MQRPRQSNSARPANKTLVTCPVQFNELFVFTLAVDWIFGLPIISAHRLESSEGGVDGNGGTMCLRD